VNQPTPRFMSESKKRSKKQILRQHIAATIAKNLMDLKETFGEKKFERKVKKASKVLTQGLSKKIKSRKKKAVTDLTMVVQDTAIK
jgi:hypothetical protein